MSRWRLIVNDRRFKLTWWLAVVLLLARCKLLCISNRTEEGCKRVSGDVLVIIALVSHFIGAYTPSTKKRKQPARHKIDNFNFDTVTTLTLHSPVVVVGVSLRRLWWSGRWQLLYYNCYAPVQSLEKLKLVPLPALTGWQQLRQMASTCIFVAAD